MPDLTLRARRNETPNKHGGFMNWKFDSLLHFITIADTNQPLKEVSYQELVCKWKEHHLNSLSLTTQIRYHRCLNGPLIFFNNFQVKDITPILIDQWLDYIKKSNSSRTTRLSFSYELKLLKNILTFYREYYEVSNYDIPLRKRHMQKSQSNKKSVASKSKEITLSEFKKFVNHLPRFLQGLAQIQYFQALRISEVAALHWEDINLNEEAPANSYIRIQRSLKWINCQNLKLEDGFKNSKAHQGFKDIPLFPEAYDVIKKLKISILKEGKQLSGFVFLDKSMRESVERPLQYRKIQYLYDKAFYQARLNYTGTHIMRHGGSRRFFKVHSNYEIAKQFLGHSDVKTTMLYTPQANTELSLAIQAEWNKKNSSLSKL